MENKIETIVEGTDTIGVAAHAGLRKGAVILGVAGIVGVVGFIANKFIIKPVIKKIKAKKSSKEAMQSPTVTLFGLDSEDDDECIKIFDEDDE